MFGLDTLETLYVVIAFLFQIVLIVYFALLNKPFWYA